MPDPTRPAVDTNPEAVEELAIHADDYNDEPDPLRRQGIYLELAEAPHVEVALATMVSLRGTGHHAAARYAWYVIRALAARAERAEAAPAKLREASAPGDMLASPLYQAFAEGVRMQQDTAERLDPRKVFPVTDQGKPWRERGHR